MPREADPALSERRSAAIHVRARDLRKGDYVVGEGLIKHIEPSSDQEDVFHIRWARSAFYNASPQGSKIYAVVVDGEQRG